MTAAPIWELIEHGEYPEAKAEISRIARPNLEQQILAQLLAVEISEPITARQEALALLERRLDTRERVLCLLAISRASSVLGAEQDALDAGRQAVDLGGRSGDRLLLSRAQARYASTVLRCTGIEGVLPELRRLRGFAFAAADSAALTEFHCLVAEIEMKQRRNHNALAHLRAAQGLCDRYPHARLQTQIFRLTANVALFSSRPRDARDWAESALKMAERSGGYLSFSASLSTLAHACLISGDIDEAKTNFYRILSARCPEGARLAAIDGLIQVALQRGDIAEAERLIATVQEPPPELQPGYYWLWHVPVRAKCLVQRGAAQHAMELLQRYSDAAAWTQDERLQHAFRLAELEVIAACGHTTTAAARLAVVLAQDRILTLEGASHLNRISSTFFDGSSAIARNLHTRAERIQKIALAQVTPSRTVEEQYSSAFELLHAAASFFTTPVDSQLMANDVMALLNAARIADAVVEVKANSEPPRNVGEIVSYDGDQFVIVCGQSESSEYRVTGRSLGGPESYLAVLAIALLMRSAAQLAARQEPASSESPLWPQDTPESHVGMIVASANMTELLNVTRRVATSNVTVLFTGETGTGKELLARALHDASPRRDKPFVPFNCTAVARDMLDSQLFGYRRGAFTGAHEPFPGIIRAALGGTLFLDEIGELPLDVQPKLLRFLESGEVHPLGETRPSTVDVRIVAATNADLEQLVSDGRFREDLFYRLNVVRLQVPPLRERREEIPMIAQHYIDLFSRDAQKTGIRLAEETMEYLVLYKWPGNVRQLTNEIRRLVALAESGAVLMPEHLSREIAASRRTIPTAQRELASTEVVVRMDQPMSAAFEHVERAMIQYAMALAEGRVDDAAHMLGLSRKGLYLKRARLKMTAAALDDEEENTSKAG